MFLNSLVFQFMQQVYDVEHHLYTGEQTPGSFTKKGTIKQGFWKKLTALYSDQNPASAKRFYRVSNSINIAYEKGFLFWRIAA